MDYPIGFMAKGLFQALVDEFSNQGGKTIVPFFRGEPFLHPECMDLFAYAKSKDQEIQLATNGTGMTAVVAHSLVDLGIDMVSFSADAVDPEKYRRMRRGNQFARLIGAVETLAAARATMAAALPKIQISAVDVDMGTEERMAFVSFWGKYADRIRIYPQHSKDGHFGSLSTSGSMPRQACLKAFEEMVIYWDGRAVLCNHDWNRHQGLGDAAEDGLKRIWEGPAYEAVRDQQRTLCFPEETLCKNCGHWQQYSLNPVTVGEVH